MKKLLKKLLEKAIPLIKEHRLKILSTGINKPTENISTVRKSRTSNF